MKIGHISLSYRPIFGGQDTYIESLKGIFEKSGVQNTVYQALSRRHKIDRNGVKVVRTLPLIGRFVPNFNWYYFNWRLRSLKSSIQKEDVLIVHYAVHYPAIKWHPRTVIVSHGIEWHTPFDQWDDKVRANRAKEAFKNTRLVANDTEYLRFCGIDILPRTRYFEEVAPGKWFIPNCVDTAKFKKIQPDPEIKKLNAILVPRNIYYHRGVHLAIEAFGQMVKRGNTTNTLVIVGKIVDRDYYSKLLGLIEKFGIQSRVVFTGHKDWGQMAAAYSASVCTVIPTIDCEGTSLSALESMACETPVVATKVGGLKDLPAVLTETTAESLSAGIESVLKNRSAESSRQYEIVKRTFNIDNWSKAWTKVVSNF